MVWNPIISSSISLNQFLFLLDSYSEITPFLIQIPYRTNDTSNLQKLFVVCHLQTCFQNLSILFQISFPFCTPIISLKYFCFINFLFINVLQSNLEFIFHIITKFLSLYNCIYIGFLTHCESWSLLYLFYFVLCSLQP